MGEIIYGVDFSEEVTPLKVRDAIIQCFFEAHKEVLDDFISSDYGSEKEVDELKKMDIKIMIKKFFKDQGGDFDNPTKESLKGICGELRDFSKKFRSEKLVEKHYQELISLINRLE